MFELRDKVVVVTGAGKGLGRSIALAFAGSGAHLALNDLTPINLGETVAQIKTSGARVKDYIFDLARRMPAEEFINEVLSDWGRVDILINHTFVHPRIPLLDMDEWDFRRTLEVNLGSSFYTTQLVGRAMREQGQGIIINIVPGLGNRADLKDSAAFAASINGLLGLTCYAAGELSPYNIRVDAVCPLENTIDFQNLPDWDGAYKQIAQQHDPIIHWVISEQVPAHVLSICSKVDDR